MSYISIRNWTGSKGFQHYRDRNPPWIKNYTELLSNDDYLALTGDQRSILHGLWLEYARSSCRLPADTRSLTRRLNLRVTSAQLNRLVQAGFIDIVASKLLAEGYQTASASRARVETEAETETQDRNRNPTVNLATSRGDGDGDDWGTEPEQAEPTRPSEYDLPTLEQRPELERDNGMSRLSADEVLGERRVG